MENFLYKLQHLPYNTRIKILWGVVIVVAVVLLGLVVINTKNTISNAGSDVIPTQNSKYVSESPVAYATIERVEQNEESLKIYFNLNNPGDDILNVPKISDITLTFGNEVIHPTQMTDRQGSPFFQKILSHTQGFGILTFLPSRNTTGTLIFDQMFLEKSPNDLFQQTISIDLDQLNTHSDVRN